MEQKRFAPFPEQAEPNVLTPPFAARSAARERYISEWMQVKRARFNAAKRLERQQDASTLAFAAAGIFGFVIPFFVLRFEPSLSQHTRDVLDFTAFLSGALSMTLGLIEQAKNYPMRARKFDQCGRRVNAVIKRLTTTPIRSDEELRPFIEEYGRALDECDENHEEVDVELAEARYAYDTAQGDDRTFARKELEAVRRKLTWKIFRLYLAIWVLPPLVGLVVWLFLR